jgi:hypothetical protein
VLWYALTPNVVGVPASAGISGDKGCGRRELHPKYKYLRASNPYPTGDEEAKGRSKLQIIERTQGYYEVEDVEFGTVYKWQPASVAVECGCGTTQDLTESMAVCGECGADHAVAVREELAAAKRPDGEAPRPWR